MKTDLDIKGNPTSDASHIETTSLSGVLIIRPPVFKDNRGEFMELYRRERDATRNIPVEFVQDNLSRSRRNVLRGMHYQRLRPQAKLVTVTRGAVLDTVVDIRKGSPTFGRHFSIELNDTNRVQLFIPCDFAHGFCVLSEVADFYYKCSTYYDPADEAGFRFDSIAIDWPSSDPVLSEKDRALPPFRQAPLPDS